MQSRYNVHRIIILAWLVLGCVSAANAMRGSLVSAPPAYHFRSTSTAISLSHAIPAVPYNTRSYAPASRGTAVTPITYRTSTATPAQIIMGGGSSATGGGYGGGSRGGSGGSYAPSFSIGALPSFSFRTTSVMVTPADDTPSGITPNRAPMRANAWGDPDDYDPIGGVQDPQPIGEPLVLAVMALLYGAVLYLRRRRELSNNP